MDKHRWLARAVLAALSILPLSSFGQIKDGDLVTFEYTLRDDQGNQLDSSKGKKPLTYEHGRGILIPGLERQLTGMKPGETKMILVKPDEAYGLRDPRNIHEIPKDKLPEKDVKAGKMFVYVGQEGERIPVTVLEVKDKTVILDFNNPLAGKTLLFDVKILDVKKNDHATTRPQTTRP